MPGPEKDAPDDEPAGLTGGQLSAAIARTVVRQHRAHFGRGPTKAQAFFRGAVVVVVLEDGLTHAEQSLVSAGKQATVLQGRADLQELMRDDLVAAVERLTGQGVRAFMSTNHIEPDLAAEVFVLDAPVPGQQP
jgi:uncharacterized protein YbcI